MKIRMAFKQGFLRVFSFYKIIGIIFIVNLFAALMVAIPFASNLDSEIAQRPHQEQYLQFDYSWWQEIEFKSEGLLETLRPSLSSGFGVLLDNFEMLLTGKYSQIGWYLFSLGIVYLFVTAFLNGGIISFYLDEQRKFTFKRFFSYCGQYFNHMIAIAVTALLIFLAYYLLLNPFLFSIGQSITASSLNQILIWLIQFVVFLVLLIIMFILDIIFDYSKIIVIQEEKDSSWLSIWLAIKFIAKNFGSIFGLYLLVFLFSGAVLFIGGLLISAISTGTAILIIFSIILQQIVIMAQITLRLTFYSTEVSLYQSLTVPMKKIKKIKR